MSTESPSFNLKAVVRETGIKAETLRAWERRYGIPRPARSSGGHRLYSRRDIDTLRWLKQRRLEGLSISRAAERWQTLESEGRDPLQEQGIAPDQNFYGNSWSEAALVEGGESSFVDDQITAACSEWTLACTGFDEFRAQRILTEAFALFPVETVSLHVLCSGLRQLGEDWHAGKVTTQQVSFATSQAMQHIKILVGACPPPTRPGLVLLACPHGENHTFGLALLQLILRRKGFGTVFLGENLSPSEMEIALSSIQPDLVVLVSQQLRSAGNLLDMSELINRQSVPVAFGGRIFNLSEVIRRAVPGNFLGIDLLQAGSRVESLLATPGHLAGAAPPINRFEDLISRYRASLHRISGLVLSAERGTSPEWDRLGRPSYSINSSLMSALRFGDLTLVSLEAEWICTFLESRNIPLAMLEEYLNQGISAVQTVLGVEGDPIVSMLETLGKDVRQCYSES
ncbi:MAG: MerR family transcriptional regulator [Caldilineaceae bacterium SB0665_bin_25]|nr:MerR family transcriptional regulator [Caldilineaceae bacterium]MXZ23193.1 MerR family transcriptional regulator [Caldilineaceae bacterium SB0665_bin_25]